MKNKTQNKKLFALFISIVMIFSAVGFPVSVKTVNAAVDDMEILAFEEFSNDVKNQKVSIGTPLEKLELPKFMTATAGALYTTKQNEIKNEKKVNLTITDWKSNPSYNPDLEGSYSFSPIFSENYSISTALPVITITVLNSNLLDSKAAGLQITGGTKGTDYDYAGGVLTVKSSIPITISGTSSDCIVVAAGVNADITLNNVVIKTTNSRPFDMNGAEVTLHLQGTNSFTSPDYKAALFCPKGSKLTIDGSGTLTATVGSRGGAAAIGGESAETGSEFRDWRVDSAVCGEIIINNGTVNANCPVQIPNEAMYGNAYTGIAIGGQEGGPITINGGTVTAIGRHNTVAIGSFGYGENFKGIFINGGTVTAKVEDGAPLNDMGSNTSLGPAIGVTGGGSNSVVPITITGGKVFADGSGHYGAAGIGGGRNGSGGIITIAGNADVTAKGGYGAAGIGGGYAQNGGAYGGTITIEGDSKVNATGGINAPAIGSGAPRQANSKNDACVGVITIAGNADITAKGGVNCPGIGSGGSSVAGMNFPDCSIVEKIVITENAKVNATGGSGSMGNIGVGSLPNGNTSPEERFQQYICTVPGITTSIEAANSLTIDADGNYIVKGNVALNRDFTIPEGKTLTIPNGAVLSIPAGVTFTYPKNSVIGIDGLKNTGGQIIEDDGTTPVTYLLTVVNGEGSGDYAQETKVAIRATVPSGKQFDKWELTSGNGSFENSTAQNTTFTMGAQNTIITALFKEIDSGETTPTITKVSVSPQTAIVEKGKTQQFTADVEGTGNYSKEIVWSVSGGTKATNINQNGLLTIDTDETAQTLTVTVVSAKDSSKTATAVVTVAQIPVTHYTLTVKEGTGSGTYTQGTKVAISATVPSGKQFVRWEQTGAGVITDAVAQNTTFTIGAGNAEITATFKNRNSSSGGGGGGSNSTVCNFPINPERTLSAVKKENGTFIVDIPEKTITETIEGDYGQPRKVTVKIKNIDEKEMETMLIQIAKKSLQSLAKNQSNSLEINSKNIVVQFDNLSLKEIDKKSGDAVTIKLEKQNELSQEAKTMIGDRPVYDITINYIGTIDGKKSTASIKNFNSGKVMLGIPYELNKGEKAENIRMVTIDENGKVNWVEDSRYDEENKMVTGTTNHFSVYGVGFKQTPAQAVTSSDTAKENESLPVFSDIEGHWAKNHIDYIVSKKILSGTSDKAFSPDLPMTRGMFVTALGRLSNINPEAYKNNKFSDVKSEMYYAPYIEWASDKGIVSGVGENLFAPEKAVTRQEIAVIMTNYAQKMGIVLPSFETVNFSDNSQIDNWAFDAVRSMQQAGILSGKNENQFDPKGTATRAEISVVFHRFMEL